MLLQSALEYLHKYNFSIIPVKPDKKPYIKWEEFQKRKPTEDEIKDWWNKWPSAMIGIVTGEISDLFIIDIDTKEGQANIEQFIPDSLITPTVLSPRGGNHLYFRNPKEKLTIGAGVILGTDFRGNGGFIVAPPSSNGVKKSYRWVEGLGLDEVPLADVPSSYVLYLLNNSIIFNSYSKSKDDARNEMFVKGRRDNDLFHVANVLVKGRMPENEIKQVIEKLALSCSPPFPVSEIPDKIESAIKRSDRADFNLTEEIRQWISVTNGNFSVTNCNKSLQDVLGVTKRNMGNIRVIFKRLVDEGLIERVTNQDGWFRRIEKDEIQEVDWKEAEDKPLDIKWPFDIESLIEISPRQIIILAGSPDAGKTAFLLNFIEKNQNAYKINYFSSEMGKSELKKRIAKFGYPLNSWNFKFFEKGSHFGDATAKFPNDINIFDFLEVTGGEGAEFYKVAAFIKEIFDKLKEGLAIIAIQKNFNVDLGRGGLGTLEKARLYLSLEKGIIKIIKAKNWVSDKNPNGLSLEFKIVNGCKLIQCSEWSTPWEDVKR